MRARVRLACSAATFIVFAGSSVAVAGSSFGKPTGASARPVAKHAAPAAGLRAKIEKAFKGSTAGDVHWRFDIDGVGELAQGAAKASHPASNEKLFTAETALQLLGPDYRYRTEIGTIGAVRHHVLHGSLVVIGGGAPLLSNTDLQFLAKQVHRSGIGKVTSGMIVNDTRYQVRTTAPGWKKHFVPEDLGPIDAFAVDGDEWNDSARAIAHPGVTNGGLFRHYLQRDHVKVGGQIRLGHPKVKRYVAHELSEPLSEILDYTLTQSDNFAAEMILDELGYADGSGGTRAAGVAVVRREVANLGAQAGTIVDGSGLSYSDKESPDLLVGWLEAIAASTTGTDLRDDLPVACEPGTLDGRLCGPTTSGKVQAKTGHLNHDNVLSGYFATKSGRSVTFSIMLSKVRNQAAANEHIDDAVAAVARYDG